MGVKFAAPDKGDSIVAVARNAESVVDAELEAAEAAPEAGTSDSAGETPESAPATVPASDAVPSDESRTDDAETPQGDTGGDE